MNRIAEDRLLIDECEQAFTVLNNFHKGKLAVVTDMLAKIKKHREKFTRRVLDKQEYIRKNEGKFSVIFRSSKRFRIGGSFAEQRDDKEMAQAKEYEKQIYEKLVADGFYSAKTARMDVMRSLLYHYEKMLNNKEI